MASDDHKQGSDYNSGNNKSSKKLKQKKIPQRGLGVAQLEKIRKEELQKKQNAWQNNSTFLSPDFRSNPVSHIDISLPDSIFQTNNLDPVLFSKQANIGQGNGCKMWNGERILEGQSYDSVRFRLDQSDRFGFRSNTNLIYDSVPVLASAPGGIPRRELFQQQHFVKVPPGSSSSSVITYNPIEPPSNQSFYSNLLKSSSWPDEKKMTGVKRPYPFPFDNPPDPAFLYKIQPVHFQNPLFQSSAEQSSRGNVGKIHIEQRNPLPREAAADLKVMAEMRTKKAIEQNEKLNGDFLTLAPPKPPIPDPEELESGPQLQENADRPNIYNFFPSEPNDETTSAITSFSGEVAEKLDLNLKL